MGVANNIQLGAAFGCLGLTLLSSSSVRAGDTTIINSMAGCADGTISRIDLTCSNDGGITYNTTDRFVFNKARVDNNTVNLNFFQVNNLTGAYNDASLAVTTGAFLDTVTTAANFSVAATTTSDTSVIGCIAGLNTQLQNVDKFWDASGNNILANPATITLVEGDGKQTSITISGSDTFGSLQDKLNDAIGNGLGQTAIVGCANAGNFATFVTNPCSSGLEAVQGTMVIRSAIAGQNGQITFVGDDSVVSALSLMTIQCSVDNNFYVNVTNAHTMQSIASCVKLATNDLVGVVNANVDVQFAANTGVNVGWNSTTNSFTLTGGSANACATFVHLADRTMVLQVGANQKQDIGFGIGNMGTAALGVDNVQVTSNDLANQAIGKIDKAITMVSSQQASLGAYQDRLGYTIDNLNTSYQNMTAALSSITDVDMAKEMMNYSKYNVMNQAATAMLAQANQLPQQVLTLLR